MCGEYIILIYVDILYMPTVFEDTQKVQQNLPQIVLPGY